ncbi:MAG: MFS transporter [Deltaproteobacteria bacterium]|nr:MFS transporter [Deltaproteobacteria bacterium]
MVAEPAPSAWSPLRQGAFRAVWLASLVSNIGTWMQSTSAAWLMTSLTASPLLVALMQTAASLPFLLLALPAGALADIVDRRHVLIATQLWMFAAAAALGGLALEGRLDAWGLLGLTFALGLGAAVMAPAWQAFVPELVPRGELPAAVALGGVSFNLARAVGPAVGGLVVAAYGASAVFALNAASFLVVVGVLLVTRSAVRRATSSAAPERVIGAIVAGLRYARHSSPLRAVLLHCATFTLAGSALWALLPVVARRDLHLEALGYGLLVGCLGVGAIAGAWALPYLRGRLGADRVLFGARLGVAAVTALLGVTHDVRLLAAAMVGGGIAWMVGMSTVNIAAQHVAPGWVRARALAANLLVVQGGLALGSLAAGALADRVGTPQALAAFAVAMGLGAALTWRARLHDFESLDLTPGALRPAPELWPGADAEGAPVLVTVEYDVDPADADAFAAAAVALEPIRRRDGAIEWGLYRDLESERRFVEVFLVPSWLEHLRQHERITVSDRRVQERINAYSTGGRAQVSHLLGVD